MQRAINSCGSSSARCTVLLTRTLFPKRAIYLSQHAGIFATAQALIFGHKSQLGEPSTAGASPGGADCISVNSFVSVNPELFRVEHTLCAGAA